MEIKRIIVGYLEENCYILKKDNNYLIIDPGDNASAIKENIKGNVTGVLITHHHFDHIGALKELLEYYQLEENNFNNQIFNFEVIKTPGHTSDSLSFYFPKEKIMFTGDFIFQDTIGRMDMPTGSIIDMQNSLKRVSYYPKDIMIYPGHGNSNILGNCLEEIKKNFPF